MNQPTPPWRGPRKRVAEQWSGSGPAEPRKGGGAKALSVELADKRMVERLKVPSKK